MSNASRKPQNQRWEGMLQLQAGSCPDKALVDACAMVGDALFMAWLNWDACRPEANATAADLNETAKMIIQHFQWLHRHDAKCD